MSLLDTIQQHLDPNAVQQISERLGTDPGTTNNAIQAALPMMMGGMASTAQQPGGEQAIQNAAAAQGGAGEMLGGLGGLGALTGMLGGGSGAGGILDSILGQHTTTVQNGVQSASGLDSSKARTLLTMLAPIVMAAVAHHAAQSSGGSGGLGSILQQAASAAQQNNSSSPVGGVLGQIMGRL